jgi:hypothetical protein
LKKKHIEFFHIVNNNETIKKELSQKLLKDLKSDSRNYLLAAQNGKKQNIIK